MLKSLWQQTLESNGSFKSPYDWNTQVNCIYKCGKGLEETLRYLHSERPTFDAFIAWMTPKGKTGDNDIATEDTLAPADITFFEENGYVVIKKAITMQEAAEARNAILEYLQADLADPVSWYKHNAEQRGLMLMFYHHPALEVVRNSARVRKAYEQLYGTAAIHKVIDKVSFNPPVNASYSFMGSPLHWDVSLATPIPFKLQGLLYLSDVAADGGAFSCVPGFNNKVEEWLKNLPQGINPREEAIRTLKPVPVTGNAGDFIIWHQALPHCATANRSNTPRFVQYHTYLPDNVKDQEVWI